MRILFAGTPEPAAHVLRHLLGDSPHEVVAVLTRPDARRGRGRSLHPSPVAEVAGAAGVPVHRWSSLKPGAPDADRIREILRGYADTGVDAVAVVAYGQILPADVLDIFRFGWINLHFSLLPRWRGAAPVQAAIAAGDRVTGATTFRIVPALDAGPVIGTVEETVTPTDTADDLLTRLTVSGGELLSQSLTGLESGTAVVTEQPDHGATYAGKITTADAGVDWRRPAAVIQRVTRAHTPAPGAWTTLDGERYKLGLLLPVTQEAELSPGEVLAGKSRVLVGTGDAALEITRIQPPGRKMMTAADWARGRGDLGGKGSTGEARTVVFDPVPDRGPDPVPEQMPEGEQ